MAKVVVVGAGTWGVVIASLLASNGHEVVVWARRQEAVDKLNNTHEHDKLEGIKIDKKVLFSADLKSSVEDKDVVVVAVPSIGFRDCIKEIIKYASHDATYVSLTKGMEDKTLYTMSEIIEDELSKNGIKNDKIVALSGPTHAEEVGKNFPSTIVSASKNKKAAEYIQDIFMNERFRVYTNDDIKGVEVCAAFKNIIALASGILKGLGYGDNIRAALLTRGLHEMTRVCDKLSLKIETFYGLAGIGDMIVTACSTHSRNFKCGTYIGEGMSVKDAVEKVGMVVEGINFIPKAIELRDKYDIELPITTGIASIVIDGKSPKEILSLLMTRKKKSE